MTLEAYLEATRAIQIQRSGEVLAAEAACKRDCEAPLAPKHYPNTNYWDRVGPQIDARRLAWRNEDRLKRLDDQLDAITFHYQDVLDSLGEPEC